VFININVRFNDLINRILEGLDLPPPPPPGIVQKEPDKRINYQELYELIKDHEGYRNYVYKDSLGIPTIGVGFNLTRPDARKLITKVGANFNKIVTGEEALSDQQVKDLYDICIKIAINDAQTFMPNLINQPKNIKLAVVDMAFNLGYNRLSKFKNTKALILAGKYNDAANEILNSKWANQVKRRAQNVAKLIVTA